MATPKRPLTDDEILLQYARQQTGNNPTLSQQGMVTLGLNTAAGVPPVAPGYDINPAIRSAQAAEDRAMQTSATAPFATNTGIGANPDVPVTPDMVRARTAGQRDPDVPMANTPTVPAAQPTPAAPAATGMTGSDYLTQAAQRTPGSLATWAGNALANTGPAGTVMSRYVIPGVVEGAQERSAANAGARAGARQAPVGAVRRQAPGLSSTTTIGEGLSGELSPEDQAVVAQDRANLKESVDALNKNFDKSNELMNRADAMTQGPTYANQRGNYSMTGTSPDVIAAARRRADTGSGGVNFGFAPGEASARLAGYAAQDQANAEANTQRRAAIQADVERIGLRNAMTRGTPQERRAARQQMEALDARMNLGTQQLGETTRQRISTAGDVQRAGLSAQAAMAGSEMDAMSRLQAAQIAGEYGLAGEQAKAAIDVNSPENGIKQQRLSLAAAAMSQGDYEAANRYLNGLSAPAAPAPKMEYTQDAMGRPTGVWVNGVWRPLTPQEQADVNRVNAGYTPAQN